MFKLTILKQSLLAGIIFFILGFLTLPDYGVNWDTINHLTRGQAYLNYFLTGNKDYSNLSSFKPYWQKTDTVLLSSDQPKDKIVRRSMYQIDSYDYQYFVINDGYGHPPLSDVLSSIPNYVFFQKLGILNDIDSYHVYGIFLAACLVSLVYFWFAKYIGIIAGLVSALSLSLYPLFWSESHFNTEKDIPQTVYSTFFLFCVWNGVRKRSPLWVLASGIFFGLGLGTKLNIVFVGLIAFVWVLLFWSIKAIRQRKYFQKVLTPDFLMSLIIAPTLGLFIVYLSWPYLWADPIGGLTGVINYYHGIGTAASSEWSWYAASWIVYTTPIIILLFSFIGLLISWKKDFNKELLGVLAAIWFLVPIIRVTLPGSNIYGGVRQIMEYVPAMALLSGMGAQWFYNKLSKRFSSFSLKIFFVFVFVPLTINLVVIHPNENAYFNLLIGGLSGAKEKDIAYWGNTFGAAYRPAVGWINQNAENGAEVVMAYELMGNIPSIWLRPDLEFSNLYRSGYLQNGEYAVTLTFDNTKERSYYDMYLEDMLEPIFQSGLNNVSVVKVWKNSPEYLKFDYEEVLLESSILRKTEYGLLFDLKDENKLSRLEVEYYQSDCLPLDLGFVEYSKDGSVWQRIPGALPVDWRIAVLREQPKDGYFIEPFIAQSARYIKLILSPTDTCLSNVKNYKIYVFE